MTLTNPEPSHISIIIPTLNEGKNLGSLLDAMQGYQGLEIIVADGGSTDNTLDIAREHGVKIVTAPAGRGIQQNEGARKSSGGILLFLHCDSRLPDNFPDLVHTVLNQPGTAAGSFRLRIDAIGGAYRLIEWGTNVRSLLLGLPYGDQALFVRKNTFDQAGGFPVQPLLEDLKLVCRLKCIGRVTIAPAPVTTSARRWQRLGVLRTTLVNQIILAGYLLGIKPVKLASLYKR